MNKNFKTDNKSFMVYKDWDEYVEALESDEEAGRLFKALFAYAKRGEEPELGGALKMAFLVMKNTLERDGSKWEKTCASRSEAGKLGGRPRGSSDVNEACRDEINEDDEAPEKAKKANGFSKNQSKAKKADTDTDIDTDKDKETDTDTETERETNTDTESGSSFSLSGSRRPCPPPPPKQTKSSFGEYNNIKLSCEEYDRLVSDFGRDKVERFVKRCDEYVARTGKSYKDYYITARKWITEDSANASDTAYAPRPSPKKHEGYERTYDVDAIEEFQRNHLMNRKKMREQL